MYTTYFLCINQQDTHCGLDTCIAALMKLVVVAGLVSIEYIYYVCGVVYVAATSHVALFVNEN